MGLAMFEMKEEYLIGVKEIDEEHERLFQIAQEAYEVLKDEFVADKFDHIAAILQRLKEYTVQHFADEEAYMMRIGYKKLLSHKVEHMEFIEKLEGYDLENIDENQEAALVSILEFLGDWLVNHILERDKLIGKDV
jgi:hemerythrin-like metal-binding domain